MNKPANDHTAYEALTPWTDAILRSAHASFPEACVSSSERLDTQGHHNGGWLLCVEADGLLLEAAIGRDPDTGRWIAWALLPEYGDYADAAPRDEASRAAADLVALVFDAAKAAKEQAE